MEGGQDTCVCLLVYLWSLARQGLAHSESVLSAFAECVPLCVCVVGVVC